MSAPVTDEEAEAMEARVAASGDGEWRYVDGPPAAIPWPYASMTLGAPTVYVMTRPFTGRDDAVCRVLPITVGEASFVASAHADMPRLLADRRQMRATIDALTADRDKWREVAETETALRVSVEPFLRFHDADYEPVEKARMRLRALGRLL